ncbi:MAG: UpxY family transcription antiterminator [Bacteroidales bacterium]|nr:UpxY family transcription antiterminator [Bacteroidales bacterium]MDD2387805.1 UpxY family transcription antiterminator [Bacteroidales bacterium]MDD4218535.1 UpxY family transcription antiterminator [Bacteroidales bacterium]MDY0143126.1 UpxY family transcription antiterminator [Bacteroidales bacterium]
MPKEKKWYVFYCKSRSEKKADLELKARGYESYLPTMQQDRVWSDRIKKVVVPMFSGYIFVHCFDFEIIKILQTPQVVTTVKIGKEYATIKSHEIEILHKVESERLKVIIESQIISEGDVVEIGAGVMRGYSGICIEEAGSEFLVIAIEGINQSLKIKIDKGMVKKV